MTSEHHPVLGEPVPGWKPPVMPEDVVLSGRYVHLEPLMADAHAVLLYDAFAGHDDVWDYMFVGPFHSTGQFHKWVLQSEPIRDPRALAIRNLDTGRWEGMASFMRIAPEAGSIEVGSISYSPALQRTQAATEAMFLMMQWAFEAGYRRYEWKCNARNMPSRRAAQRLGFSYEGIFRQAMVVKGHNRDTAWFAVIDKEWPALKSAFETWLDPANFTPDGRQITSLADLTTPIRVASDPDL